MIAKCNCNNCSVHIEFDSSNAGATIACPHCKMDTVLYVPAPRPVPKISKEELHKPHFSPNPADPREHIKAIRESTCYQTLRTLIDRACALAEVLVGVVALILVVSGIIVAITIPDIGVRLVSVVVAVFGLFGGYILVMILRAIHQATLLLVDIADCSIRLTSFEENRPANLSPDRSRITQL